MWVMMMTRTTANDDADDMDDDDDDDHRRMEFSVLMMVPLMDDSHHVTRLLQLRGRMDAREPRQPPWLHAASFHARASNPLEDESRQCR